MKDAVQHITDAKIASSAVVSGGSWLVSTAEQIEPVVAVVSGLVAIAAGVLAIIWTGIRIYDRYKGE